MMISMLVLDILVAKYEGTLSRKDSAVTESTMMTVCPVEKRVLKRSKMMEKKSRLTMMVVIR